MEQTKREKIVPMEIESLFDNQRIELQETKRAVTPFGGIAVFVTYLRKIGLVDRVRQWMPIQHRSHNQIDPTATFTSFLLSVALGARRFAHIGAMRNDKALQSLLGLARFPSDDTVRNFFGRFTAGHVVRLYEPLAEARFVLHGWLRSGNRGSSRGAVEFLKEALALWGQRQPIRLVRADSGFFDDKLLQFLEQHSLPYVVVARLTQWVKRSAQGIKHWRQLDEDYAAGEFQQKLHGWDTARRFVVIRERVREARASVGRRLFDFPGYTFRVFVTNRGEAPECLWRDYNPRADIENRIAELKDDLAADDFCLRQFEATAAAFRAVLVLFNLLAEFQRAAGSATYRRLATLRSSLFVRGAFVGRSARKLVPFFAQSWGGLVTRKPMIESILCWPIPTPPKLHFPLRT
jgi:hypothetical protein